MSLESEPVTGSTTAAAIDRLVHHATIVEMAGPSVRAEAASTKKETSQTSRTTTTATTTTPGDQPDQPQDGER
jgi:hypothetical protein